nr:hypothetical protein [uncultured Lachnoclostridium sp.]
MLKFYVPETIVSINNMTPFSIDLHYDCISENPPETENIKMNWNNIEYERNQIDIWLPFGITKTRRGLKLFFWDDLFTNVKQWKEDLNVEIKTTWTEYKPTIKDIINFRDSDKAIQYLVERGLSMSPLMKNFI